jgi:hypothetical protein
MQDSWEIYNHKKNYTNFATHKSNKFVLKHNEKKRTNEIIYYHFYSKNINQLIVIIIIFTETV